MQDQPTPVSITELRIDERYWPKGSSEVVRRWIAEEYDPETMPPLIVSAKIDGKYLLGWESDGETLFHAIFGRDLTAEEKQRAAS